MEKFTITLWDNEAAKKSAQCQITKELTLDEMFALDAQRFEFQDLELDGLTIDAADVCTESVALVAKYIVKPFINGEFKLPLGAYLAAMSDDVYCESVQSEDDVLVQNTPENKFDLRTVKEWAESRLMMFSDSELFLFDKMIDNRIDALIEKVKTALGEDMANFINFAIDRSSLISVYAHDMHYGVMSWADCSGNKANALFKLNHDEHDDLFAEIDAKLMSSVKI